MSYTVTAPLVAIAPTSDAKDREDANQGPRYFYQGAVIPDGFNDERCKQLVEEGMLEKVKAQKASTDSGSSDTVDGVLKEVGDDKEKAAAALEAEQAKGDKARSTLVEKLQAVING